MFKEIEFDIGFSDGRHMAVTAVDEAAARWKAERIERSCPIASVRVAA